MDLLIIVPSISRQGGGVSEVVRLVNSSLRKADSVKTEVWAFADDDSAASLPTYFPTKIRLFRAFLSSRFGFCPQMIWALFLRKPDIVYVHGLWMFHCLAVHIWARLTGGKYVVVPHGMLEPWILRRSPQLKRIVSLLFQSKFIRRAHFVQCLTEKEIDDVRNVSVKANGILVPNFVDISVARTEKPKWWMSDFQGRSVFLYFGRIHEKKGCVELLRAWDIACRDDEGFRAKNSLVFAGWIDGLSQFEPAVAELASRVGNVHFVGPQYHDDKAATLTASTFLVLPSHSEGLPMAVLEAWSMGKPVLMTAACNLPIGFSAGAAIKIDTSPEKMAASLRDASALAEPEIGSIRAAALKLTSLVFSEKTVTQSLLDAFGAPSSPILAEV